MTVPSVEAERICPDCSGVVPTVSGFMDWCEHCGWNLRPPATDAPPGRFDTFCARLAERPPSGAGSRTLAVLVAALVLAFASALPVAGVLAVALEPGNPAAWLAGALGVLLGWLMRPRLAARPAGVVADSPALTRLVTQVAEQRGVPAPAEIVVSAEWNAAWTAVGLRRRRVLELGLPLLAALEPQQRVALIAHELGHEDAGDLRRTFVVGSAVDALDALAAALRPPTDAELPFAWAVRPVVWLAGRPVEALLWLQARLLFRDRQRAEFLADERAAQIAGSAAVIGLHERLLQHPTVELAVQRAALGSDDAVMDGIRAALAATPQRERERRRRVARLERTRLDATHPPLGQRIAALETAPQPAALTLDTWTSDRIDAELAPLEPVIGRELVDRYRSSIF